MTYEKTKLMVIKLYSHFRQKGPPDDGYLESIFENCQNIPDAFADDLSRYIKDEFDRFPFNLSKALNLAWLKYQNDCPQKIQHEGRRYCGDCDIDNFLFIRKWTKGVKGVSEDKYVKHAVPCKNCHPGGGFTKQELEAMGYEVTKT